MSVKQTIINTIDDLVANFLYYDRKSDEDLEVGAIEDAVANNKITVDEMVERFRDRLNGSLSRDA